MTTIKAEIAMLGREQQPYVVRLLKLRAAKSVTPPKEYEQLSKIIQSRINGYQIQIDRLQEQLRVEIEATDG